MMTKAEREEYDALARECSKLDYWAALSVTQAVDMRVMGKAQGLVRLRTIKARFDWEPEGFKAALAAGWGE